MWNIRFRYTSSNNIFSKIYFYYDNNLPPAGRILNESELEEVRVQMEELIEKLWFYLISTNGACSSETIEVNLTDSPLASVEISASGSLDLCNGSTVTLIASSSLPVVWSNGSQTNEIVVSNAVTRYLSIEDLNDLPRGLRDKLEAVGSSYQRTFAFLEQLDIPY